MKYLITIIAFIIASPTLAQDKFTILLDWFINPDHGPIIVAKEMGYFKDQNLDVEIIAPADPSAPPRLVAAGKGDLAVSYQPDLHLQIHEGLPLKRVGTLIATPLACVLVLKDGPIKTPADLKGKKIGFSTAGVEHAIMGTILGKYGVSLDEVEMINVNFSLSPALMSGQVDAVSAYRNFELNQMKIEGIEGSCFYVEEEGVPSYDELIYVANPELMDIDKIARFLAATEKATQYIINYPEKSWKIFSSTSIELQDELNAMAWKDTLPRFALRPAAFDAGRYARFEKFLKEAGLIDSINPVEAIAMDVTAK